MSISDLHSADFLLLHHIMDYGHTVVDQQFARTNYWKRRSNCQRLKVKEVPAACGLYCSLRGPIDISAYDVKKESSTNGEIWCWKDIHEIHHICQLYGSWHHATISNTYVRLILASNVWTLIENGYLTLSRNVICSGRWTHSCKIFGQFDSEFVGLRWAVSILWELLRLAAGHYLQECWSFDLRVWHRLRWLGKRYNFIWWHPWGDGAKQPWRLYFYFDPQNGFGVGGRSYESFQREVFFDTEQITTVSPSISNRIYFTENNYPQLIRYRNTFHYSDSKWNVMQHQFGMKRCTGKCPLSRCL